MKRLILLALAFALCGCATSYSPPRVKLDPVTAAQIKTVVRVHGTIWQDELVVSAPSGLKATGGGLLAAAVDSKINKSRQGKIQSVLNPFYGVVDDFDFRSEFYDALEKTLREDFPLKVEKLDRRASWISTDDFGKERAALAPDQAFMIINLSYTLNANFTELQASASVHIYKGGVAESIYENSYWYRSDSVRAGARPMHIWAMNDGALYRATMRQAIAEINSMIGADIRTQVSGVPEPENPVLVVMPDGVRDIGGNLISEGKGRMIVRTPYGYLYAVPR